MRKNVLVFFGGKSCENEISLITGIMACNLLDASRFEVFPVYISQSGELFCGSALLDPAAYREPRGRFTRAALVNGKLYSLHGRRLREVCVPDCALNCCHGTGGEDGCVPALLALNGIPSASPDMAPSALFMDKAQTKLIAGALGIPVLPWVRIGERSYKRRGAMALRTVEERLGYPVIVKPARLGSSIGISVAEDRARLVYAIEAAFAYDGTVIVEKYLEDRREINCACYRKGDELVVSACEEPKTSHRILTFADKYLDGGKQRASGFPAEIPEECADRVQSYTKLLYRRTDLRGIVRADFLLSGGDVYFNEMNTVPGSLAWYLFCGRMADFTRLLTVLVEQGICDFRDGANKKLLKNCGVLSAVPRGKARR